MVPGHVFLTTVTSDLCELSLPHKTRKTFLNFTSIPADCINTFEHQYRNNTHTINAGFQGYICWVPEATDCFLSSLT